MAALFIEPFVFTVVSANQNALAPASNANLDEPSYSYRSSNLTTVTVVIDLGANPVAYDTIAIIGSNIRATDTVQVTTGTGNTGTGSFDGGTVAAFTGNKPVTATAKSIIRLASTRTERYVRLLFNAAGHPDGYVEAQRIVVGKAISTLGVNYDAEQSFLDTSIKYEGAGWSSADEYARLPQWRFSMDQITDTSWRAEWFPFLQSVGETRAFLFIPFDQTPTAFQTDALFGKITVAAKAKIPGFNFRVIDLTMTGLAQ